MRPLSSDGAANPLLQEFERALAGTGGEPLGEVRDRAIRAFAFAVPTDQALDAIARHSPGGVVEVGAGTGYWAHLLHQRGVDVVAYDVAPAPTADREWFADTEPWYPVQPGDHHAAAQHPDRTLLLVWPTKGAIWAAEALAEFHESGGGCVAFVGEGPGGRTGDEVFHALLGETTGCLQCDHGSVDSPCTCDAHACWTRVETVPLPHWPGFHDDLHLYRRADARPAGPAATGGPRRWWRPGRVRPRGG